MAEKTIKTGNDQSDAGMKENEAVPLKLRIVEIRRVEKLEDASLQKLWNDFLEAPQKYSEMDPKEFASRFVDAVVALADGDNLQKAMDFSSKISETFLGVIAQTAIGSAVVSVKRNEGASLTDAMFADRRWTHFLEIYGDARIISIAVRELSKLASRDENNRAFATAMLVAAVDVEADTYSTMASIFESEASRLKKESELDKDPASESVQNKELAEDLAYDSKKTAKRSRKKADLLRGSAALQGEKGKEAAEWVNTFTATLKERLVQKLSEHP